MNRSFDCGMIVETIGIDGADLTEEAFDYLTGFCIDVRGVVRLGRGIVAPADDDLNPNFVPNAAFTFDEVCNAPLGQWFSFELPNPATDIENYWLIRNAFVAELDRRMTRLEDGHGPD